MSQPPQPPQPSPPHDPQNSQNSQNPQHGASGPGAHPATPQQATAPAKSGIGKGPLIAIVGCGLLVVVLVLALVAFFGVRALMGDDESTDQPTASQEESPAEEESSEPAEEATTEEESGASEEPTETTEPTESTDSPEPAEDAAATGEANAVPKGTVITLEEPNDYAGSMDIVIGDVNWDATEWVSEQNSHNPQPTDQGKYIMVQAEVTYHGPDAFDSFAFGPIDYVAADGTPYEDGGVVTPDTTNQLALQDGESGTMHFVFMTPADLPEGGHFVVAGSLPLDEVLVEGQWIEAA